MAHTGITLAGYSTVLEMASSVPVDTSTFAYGGSVLCSAADSPAPGAEMQYLVLMDYGDRRTVIATQYTPENDAHIFQRNIWQGAWRQSRWAPIATATPPQEYDLPLAEGCVAHYPSTYHKEQNGKVYGELVVKHTTAGAVDGMPLCTLPEGYRPLKNRARAATIAGTGNYDHAGSIDIDVYGVVRLYGISNAGITTADFVVFADFWFLTY